MVPHVAAAVCLLLVWTTAVRADRIRVPRTGQNACYDANGIVIACAGTGQDGEKRAGAAWPSPRFIDNDDGTVTDKLTGLVWLKDANCTDPAGEIQMTGGLLNWPSALAWSNNLASGKCGLSDDSSAGDWRLPNINELRSLIDYSRHDPALPIGHPFSNVEPVWYWSSTTNPVYTGGAYNVGLSRGSVHSTGKARPSLPGENRVENKLDNKLGVWPVRDRRQSSDKFREAPTREGSNGSNSSGDSR